MKKNKLIIISRNYPPMIGGLETFSFHFIENVKASCEYDVIPITLGRSKVHLLWFLPYALLRGLLIGRKDESQIHLCDGALAPLGLFFKFFNKSIVSITLHGLDLTFDNRFYSKFVPFCIRKLNCIICVSSSTKNEAIVRGIPESKCFIIGNGIRDDWYPGKLNNFTVDSSFKKLLVEGDFKGKTVLLSLGRMIKRKGVFWFVSNVVKLLDDSFVYIIAGDGPEKDRIEAFVESNKLKEKVYLLGGVSEEIKMQLYLTANLFIMPNIKVSGDIEGFGITAIEAGACGVPVIASNIEGLQDAVVHNKTGLLVRSEDPIAFSSSIIKATSFFDKESVQVEVMSRYSWKHIIKEYLTLFQLISGKLR